MDLVQAYPHLRWTKQDIARREKELRSLYPAVMPEVTTKKRANKSKRKGIYPELRILVYERSAGKCEQCSKTAKAIHHIKSVCEYPELQWELNNLIHLCLLCHASRHPEMNPLLFLENKFTTTYVI